MNDTIAGETPPNAGNTMPEAGEHTPGPWRLVEHGMVEMHHVGSSMHFWAGCGAGGHSNPSGQRPNAELAANARLIAAAPELLAELEYAVKLLAPFGETAQVQRMRQVIAKVRGE